VWHVSVAWQRMFLPQQTLLALAYDELVGVGDGEAGEWVEYGPSAVHLRRRLSEEEAARVGPVLDIRSTPEAAERLRKVAKLLPRQYRQLVLTADLPEAGL